VLVSDIWISGLNQGANDVLSVIIWVCVVLRKTVVVSGPCLNDLDQGVSHADMLMCCDCL